LTFSTYHDRPEELPGFRLQGTTAAARPNRAALLAQGFVADLAGGSSTIEPALEPAGWARILAGWLIQQREEDEADWEATRRRALVVQAGPEGRWGEECLDRIFGLPRWLRAPSLVPATAPQWAELVAWTTWAARSGLAPEWSAARPPAWWLAASGAEGSIGPESRAALLEHLRLPAAWREDSRAAAWGEVVARWVARAAEAVRLEAAAAALSAAPADVRPSLAGGLIRGLPPEAAPATLNWLVAQNTWDPSILLPLRAHAAATSAIEAGDTRALQELLRQSLTLPGGAAGVLDALEAEAPARPESRGLLAQQLALVLGTNTGRAKLRDVVKVHRWALALSESMATEAWLRPYWERQFADRLNIDHWRAIFAALPSELEPSATRAVLQIAAGPRAVDDAFRWGIEERVLPLGESERPHDRAWAGAYFDRLPSGIDVLKRLVQKPYRKLGVARWLEQARDRGELSPVQVERFVACARYERVLRSRDARGLLEIKLPDVPAAERGVLLDQILRHLADGSNDALNVALDSCRAAWPDGFQPRAPGLALLAEALAQPLLTERGYPDLWLERLRRVLDRLGLVAMPGKGFEPVGLAAYIVAATTRHPGDAFDPWRFRAALLGDDRAWQTLTADIRRDLEGVPADESLKVLDTWDQSLDKGRHTNRFYALWFNACDPAQLVQAVVSRAVDTRDFPLPWWDADRAAGALPDIRERLARQAPMVPIRKGAVTTVRHWLQRPRRSAARAILGRLLPIEDDMAADGTTDWLISDEGLTRFRFLEQVSLFAMARTPEARNENVKRWHKDLPLDRLAVSERYQLLASILKLVEEDDPILIAPLAKWLTKGGVDDLERIKAWHQDLAAVDPVPDDVVLARVVLVRNLCDEVRTIHREAQERR
jgi:hypothetical protein